MISEALRLGSVIIDKVFPDPEQRDKAKLELLKAESNGDLEKTKQQMAAILAEAKSIDPWTSRARPSFLYVIYIMILSSIPMGFLYAYEPITAHNVAEGMGFWLDKIPDGLYDVFAIGYLGYTGARSFEKYKGFSK